MPQTSPLTDDQVIAELGWIDIPLENYFLFPLPDGEEGIIGFWHPKVGFRYLILEKDDLAKAAYEFLKQRGARQFSSGQDAWEAAVKEKWPGWDTCGDAVRDRELMARAREEESLEA